MFLQEIFDNLQYGELSQLNIGGAGQGVIDGTNYSRILPHLNAGLTDLHTRFFLNEGRQVVPLVPGVEEYALPEAVLKVEQVWTDGKNSDKGPIELVLNDATARYSVATPSVRLLRVHPHIASAQGEGLPDVLKTGSLEVVYRAGHPRITAGLGHFDPDQIEVNLPYTHLMALCYFIASRAHNPTGMVNEFHMGNSYYAKYLAECQSLLDQGMRVDRDNRSTRFERNGWV